MDLREDTGFPNVIQPYDVWVDSADRKVWSTALGTATATAVDPDAAVELQSERLREDAFINPEIVTDDLHHVWISSGHSPALFEWDPAADARNGFDFLDVTSMIQPRPGGGVVALGHLKGVRTLVEVDDDGALLASVAVPDDAAGIVADPEGVLLLNPAGSRRQWSDLAEIGTCTLPFSAENGARLADGSAIITMDGTIGWSDCAGHTRSWAVGVEDKEVVPYGSGVLILDRIGPVEPNLGEAWYLDPPRPAEGFEGTLAPSFETAKNSGFGGIDEQTGILWVNSEGTAQVVGFDPSTGAQVDAVTLGTFADGLAPNPDPSSSDAGFVATGRLSDSVVRVANDADGVGRVVARTSYVRWPYSPVQDDVAGLVWLLQQTDGVLWGMDQATLLPIQRLDLGFSPNPLLTFSTATLDPDRRRLWVAESYADELVEVDADTVTELGRWPLGGPTITDPDIIGEVAVRIDPLDGAVFIGRTMDGRLQRFDPDSQTLQTTALTADESSALNGVRQVDVLRAPSEQGVVWFGGHAFDAATLDRESAMDLPAAVVLAPDPRGGWLALSDDQEAIERLDDDGSVRGTLPIAGRSLNAMTVRMSADLQRILVGRPDDGKACWFDVKDVR